MLQNTFRAVELVDQLGTLGSGMNSGIAPLLLKREEMAMAVNVTVRGSYAKPRPPFQFRNITPAGQALLASALVGGPFQGGAYYNSEVGPETLILAIGGRLFEIFVTISPATVLEITIPGDPNPASVKQAWLWQSEKWMIWNDGVSLPVFFDGTTSVRSNYQVPVTFTTMTTATFYAPAVGAVVAGVALASTTGMNVGDTLYFKDAGKFIVQKMAGLVVELINVNVLPNKAIPYSAIPPLKTEVTWYQLGSGLPPGRSGAYGNGRNWICLEDGKTFIASDLVGGSSGTIGERYRDAVLQVTENIFLAGGGVFPVPNSAGQIRAMIFSATLDSSLGQGPLQIFTQTTVFSVQAPLDRLVWQDVTNPILTQSLLGNGAFSQNSTVTANSDIIYRSIDGIRSLILARREFGTWGNVPISDEVNDTLVLDNTDLLIYGSAITWDNRLLMTAVPTFTTHGIYHRALAVINFDPLSSLRGKEPAVYDGFWTGLNILQMVTGEFETVPRAFAFCYKVPANIPPEAPACEIQPDPNQTVTVGDYYTPFNFGDANNLFVADTSWMAPGMFLLVEGPAKLEVSAIVDGTNVEVILRAMIGGLGGNTLIPSGAIVSIFGASSTVVVAPIVPDIGSIELYELLKSEVPLKDNGTRDIVMDLQSAALFNFPAGDTHSRELKRLLDGEVYIDLLPSGVTANFQVYYKPDQWPCWVPWFSWSECAGRSAGTYKPQFRPRMGLGEPSPIPCDETTDRPLREGFTFQVRLVFSNCRFLGASFRAITVPQQSFAPQLPYPLCANTGENLPITEIVVDDTILWGEWHGGLPAIFTQTDILSVLMDGDNPIGPRVAIASEILVFKHIDLEYPFTATPTYRVTVVPTGYAINVQLPAGSTAVVLPSAGLPYQIGLNILGQLSDVYVLANADPGPFRVSDNTAFRIIHTI